MRLLLQLSLAGLLLAPLDAPALRNDREQPIQVRAARWDGALKGGVQRLTGKVSIAQGSLESEADEAELYSADGDSGDIRRIVLVGEPARLRQELDDGSGLMHASARRIEYDTGEGRAVLIGDARVDRAGDVLKAERIEYEVQSGRMRADGQGEQGQVEMILKPRQRKPAEKPSNTAPGT